MRGLSLAFRPVDFPVPSPAGLGCPEEEAWPLWGKQSCWRCWVCYAEARAVSFRAGPPCSALPGSEPLRLGEGSLKGAQLADGPFSFLDGTQL